MRLAEDTCELGAWHLGARECQRAGEPSRDSRRGQVPVLTPAFRSPRTVAEDVAMLPVGQRPWRHVLTVENRRVVQKSPRVGDQSKRGF